MSRVHAFPAQQGRLTEIAKWGMNPLMLSEVDPPRSLHCSPAGLGQRSRHVDTTWVLPCYMGMFVLETPTRVEITFCLLGRALDRA